MSIVFSTFTPVRFILTIHFVFVACILHAQTDSIKYTRDFVLKEGIYVTYKDFKNNKPNLTPENFKQYNPGIDYLSNNFFENKGFLGVKKRRLFYPDSSGIREHAIDSLYGYVLKNHLFIIKPIDIGSAVLRVFKLGTISYCFQMIPNRPPPNDWTLPNALTPPNASFPTGPGSTTPGYQTSSSIGMEGQYLLNLATKRIYDYKPDDFEKLLKKIDDDLYNEFAKLSRSKKKKMIFIYLNKVNEKHPIYFSN